MTYWIGAQAAIAAANQAATDIVTAKPETLDGQVLPEPQWVTERWAEPLQAIDGRWMIPAYPGLSPAGVTSISDAEALALNPVA